MATDTFSRDELLEGLTELVDRMVDAGLHAGVRIVGGAALALMHYDRLPTHDVDVLIYPPLQATQPVLTIARQMAVEHGWRVDWLNTGVLAFAPPLLDAQWLTLIRKGDVEVLVAPADLLLAMKLNAARGVRDGRDIEVLLARCGVSSVGDAEEIVDHHYPGEGLSAKAEGAVLRYLTPAPTPGDG